MQVVNSVAESASFLCRACRSVGSYGAAKVGFVILALSATGAVAQDSNQYPAFVSVTFKPEFDKGAISSTDKERYVNPASPNLFNSIVCMDGHIWGGFARSGTEIGKTAAAYCTAFIDLQKWVHDNPTKLDPQTRAQFEADPAGPGGQAASEVLFQDFFPYGLILHYSLSVELRPEKAPSASTIFISPMVTLSFGGGSKLPPKERDTAQGLYRNICSDWLTDIFSTSGNRLLRHAVSFCDAVGRETEEMPNSSDEKERVIRQDEEAELDRFFPAGVSLIYSLTPAP
jgi:hypothetical protein